MMNKGLGKKLKPKPGPLENLQEKAPGQNRGIQSRFSVIMYFKRGRSGRWRPARKKV